MARIALFAFARPTFDVAFAERLFRQAYDELRKTSHDIVGAPALLFDADATNAALQEMADQDFDLVLILQVTFTDASMTVKVAQALDAPLAIWAFPEPRLGGRLRLNAFCGLNLAAHALGRQHIPFSYLYAAPDKEPVADLLDDILTGRHQARPRLGRHIEVTADQKAEVKGWLKALEGLKIGRIGDHPQGFDTCQYDPARLKQLANIDVEDIPLSTLFETAQSVPEAALQKSRQQVEHVEGLDEVDQAALNRSLALHSALQQLGAQKRYDAFAIRCWPEAFTEYGGAMCGPAALMGEARVPCACEADVYGALSNVLLQTIADKPAFLVDLVDVDCESDTAVVWHCGQAPLSMADPEFKPKATIHSNRKMPLLLEFPLKADRVTLARISQARGQHSLFAATGTMLKAPLPFSGTAGMMRFDCGADTLLSAIMDCRLEHHTSLVYGDYLAELKAVASVLGLPIIELTMENRII